LITTIILIILSSLFGGMDSPDMHKKLEPRDFKEYVVIVLGNNRKKESQKRVDCAARVIKKYNVRKIIFSGGGEGFTTGSGDKKQKISEAEYMHNLFAEKYSELYRVLEWEVEKRSMNTYDNIKYSIKHLSSEDNVVIVSTHPRKRMLTAASRLSKWLGGTGEISYVRCGINNSNKVVYRRKK